MTTFLSILTGCSLGLAMIMCMNYALQSEKLRTIKKLHGTLNFKDFGYIWLELTMPSKKGTGFTSRLLLADFFMTWCIYILIREKNEPKIYFGPKPPKEKELSAFTIRPIK